MAISPFGVFSSGVKTSGEGFSPEFEKAIAIIKKYEGLHRNRGNLIGYGHQVIAGDGYKKRNKSYGKTSRCIIKERSFRSMQEIP